MANPDGFNLSQPIPAMTEKEIAHFWSKVRKGTPTECWPWMASCCNGYGRFYIRLHGYRANRVAYVLGHGKQPENCVCHTCDNPSCCNPSHLFDGTHRENIRDCVQKGRWVIPSKLKLTPDAVLAIRYGRKNGETISSLSRKFGVERSVIRNAINGVGRYALIEPPPISSRP